MSDTQAVYWYEDIETYMGDAEVEWRFDFAPGEYLGLFADGLQVEETDYPDEWDKGCKLAQERLAV